MKPARCVALLVFATQMFATQLLLAQNAIPIGTILPVQLNSSLKSPTLKTGQVLTARVMQDVPLSARWRIHAGAKVIGHVVNVKGASPASGAQVSIRFDSLMLSKRLITITTNLRALASMMAVDQAQIPVSGPDRGTSEQQWVTEKIGEESPLPDFFVSSPRFATKCRGEIEGNDRSNDRNNGRNNDRNNDQPQALWVFSSNACGAYGFEDLAIIHAGRTAPVGEITLSYSHGELNIRAGSGMLLRVNSKRPE